MVVQEKDKSAEIWHGKRLGAEAALARFSLDEAFELQELEEALLASIQGQDNVYFSLGHKKDNDLLFSEALNTLRDAPKESLAPRAIPTYSLFYTVRLFKSACEVAMMKAAGEISARAHKRAMQFAAPGCYSIS